MAKRMDHAYASGARTAMCKIKRMRSADCVVGGFRYGTKDDFVGSLLLGLYDDDGVLHHVGFTSGLKASEKPALTEKLREYEGPPGFTGRAPGGPSRWSTERSGDWVPLRTELVVEVEFDHYSEGRFRHGTRLLRWRPDKAPEQCTLDQVRKTGHASLDLL
jgi:ATP-dependent DNA ligase